MQRPALLAPPFHDSFSAARKAARIKGGYRFSLIPSEFERFPGPGVTTYQPRAKSIPRAEKQP